MNNFEKLSGSVLCGALVLVWSAYGWTQFNPYKEKKKAPVVEHQDAKPIPVKKKKKKGPKSKKASPPPEQVVSEISTETAFETGGQTVPEPTAEERVTELENEIASMKAMLARVGIVEDTAELSPSQRDRLGELETQLQQTRSDHKALLRAVENGLDAKEAEAELHRLEQQMEVLHAQMMQIRAESPESDPLAEQLTQSEERIASLEAELAALKQRLQNAEKEEQSAEETKKGLMAQMNELLPVEIFAFGDFMYYVQEDGPDNFAIGQLELDVAQDLTDEVTITAAIAYDSEAEVFGLGAFTIDGRILGADENHLRQSQKIESLGVILGQFDVPFGIDYMEYASIDRCLVTGPLVVDGTHAGWNDLGGQMYLIAPRFNTVVYGVNGYSYETYDVGPTGDEVVFEHPTAMALGGRVGVLPLEPLELGGSFAAFLNPDAEMAQLLAGGDLALNIADFELKGEYIYMKQGMDIDDSTAAHGFYAGALYDFKPVFVTGRYSTLWPDDEANEKQLSVGIGVTVFENAQIRLEYTSDLESGGSMAFLQLAGGTAWQPSGLRR